MNKLLDGFPIVACDRHRTTIQKALERLNSIDDQVYSSLEEALSLPSEGNGERFHNAFQDFENIVGKEIWDELEETIDCVDCALILASLADDPSLILDDPSQEGNESLETPPPLTEVPRNDPPRVFEKENDTLDQRHIVEGIYVSKGKELARRMQLSLISRSGTAMELLGMFDLVPPSTRNDESLSSSVVLLWKFPPGLTQMNSLPLDEMGFLLLEGEMDWNFENGKPVRLGTGMNNQQLLWMSANPEGHAGLPPFDVYVNGGRNATGVTFLYNWAGVPCKLENQRGKVSLDTERWETEDIEEYWESIDNHVHQMHGRRPFTASLPQTEDEFEARISDQDCQSRGDVHDVARRLHQIKDADLENWPVKEKAYFLNMRTPLSQNGVRDHPILDFRLISFFPESADRGIENIAMARHAGSFEVILSMFGGFRCCAYEPPLFESETQNIQLGELLAGHRDLEMREVISSALSGSQIPDILLLRSDILHGFSAVDRRTAYSVHIRFFDHYRHIPRFRKYHKTATRKSIAGTNRKK
jgi:hypothetical protein